MEILVLSVNLSSAGRDLEPPFPTWALTTSVGVSLEAFAL